MGRILMTLAEEREATTPARFAVRFSVDEEDCFAFSHALACLGYEVYFANWDDLEDGEFRRMFFDNDRRFVSPLAISSFDLVFVYKMEGFYFHRPRFFEMLERFERTGALVVNDPATIRHNIDKRYLWDLERRGVRILPTHTVDANLRARVATGERFVVKPIHGERGRDVHLVRSPLDLELLTGREDEFIAQEFAPSVRAGERSLAFLGRTFQHAVLKRPNPAAPDEFRCNESLGGTVDVYEPTPQEVAFATGVIDAYGALGFPVHFSRVDFLTSPDGPLLLEAELLNPSIYANYSGKGATFAASLAQYFDRQLAQRCS